MKCLVRSFLSVVLYEIFRALIFVKFSVKFFVRSLSSSLFGEFFVKFCVHSFASRFSGLARLGVAWGLGLDGSSLV